MRVLDIAFKNILQVLRDRLSFLFLVGMPLLFTLFMGIAFRGVTQPDDPRLTLGWVNSDPDGALTMELQTALENSDSVRIVPLDAAEEAERRVQNGDLVGALLIPADFSARALAGDPAQIALIINDTSTQGQSLAQLVRAPLVRLFSAAEIARINADALTSVGQPAPSPADGFAFAAAVWREAAQTAPGLILERATGEVPEPVFGGNPYNQASPGILVQFAVFGLVASAQTLVEERKTRTLQRLRTTHLPRWQILTGHWLSMTVIVFAQQLLLVAFGQLLLGVDYFREPTATLLVMLGLSFWVAALGLLIGAIAKSDDQVVLFSLIVMFIFSALGGAWFPLDVAGDLFAAIGQFTPTAWAMTGFQNIVIRGLGLGSIWQATGILLAWAAVLLILAVWRFARLQET